MQCEIIYLFYCRTKAIKLALLWVLENRNSRRSMALYSDSLSAAKQ